MSALELIARLIQHIHYPKMHYTKYFGQYSVKRRGMRRKEEKLSNPNDTFKNRKEYRRGSVPLEVIQDIYLFIIIIIKIKLK